MRQALPATPRQAAPLFVVSTGEVTYPRILALLAGLSAFCLWILPLGSSLWLDELVTYWSAYKGIVPAIARSQFWPGQNTAYTVLVAGLMRVAGTSEVVLRLPSLLAAVLTAWLLFRLAERFLDREAGILVLVVFASLHEISKEAATNARPYSIALLLVVASVLQLVRWFDNQRSRHLVGFILASAAIPYFHLLFANTYLIFLGYAIYRWRTEREVRVGKLAFAAAAIAILLAPLLWYAFVAHRVSANSSFEGTPDVKLLVSSFMPNALASTLLLCALAASFGRRRTEAALLQIPRSTVFLFTLWLILPVATLFVIARVTPFKIFVPRYYLPTFAALALIVGCGIRLLTSARMRVVIAACVVATSIVSYAGFHLTAPRHREDWRAAARKVRATNVSPTTPVLLRVGLIESATTLPDLGIDRDSPLLCPLAKYPIPGRIIPLPYRLDSASLGYMQEISSQILASTDRFVVVVRKDDESILWMEGWFSSQGFEASEVGHSEGVPVFLYRRLRR